MRVRIVIVPPWQGGAVWELPRTNNALYLARNDTDQTARTTALYQRRFVAGRFPGIISPCDDGSSSQTDSRQPGPDGLVAITMREPYSVGWRQLVLSDQDESDRYQKDSDSGKRRRVVKTPRQPELFDPGATLTHEVEGVDQRS